jgi:hypothetical protein
LRETVAAREPAADLAARIASEDGVSTAVQAIERLATTKP